MGGVGGDDLLRQRLVGPDIKFVVMHLPCESFISIVTDNVNFCLDRSL